LHLSSISSSGFPLFTALTGQHHLPYSEYFSTSLPMFILACLVILLVLLDSPTLIFSPLRLSAPHLAPCSFSIAAPKIWNSLPPSLRICTRPSSPLNPFLLAPQIRLLLTIVHVYKLYLLTYLLRMLYVHWFQL